MLLLAGLLLFQAASANPCDGDTTPDTNACAEQGLEAAENYLTIYLAAARGRLAHWPDGERSSDEQLIAKFDAAQTSWQVYRKAQCDTVYAFWQGGTIRTSMDLICQTRLTRARTHFIWQTFLTFPDSTPPMLPEPKD